MHCCLWGWLSTSTSYDLCRNCSPFHTQSPRGNSRATISTLLIRHGYENPKTSLKLKVSALTSQSLFRLKCNVQHCSQNSGKHITVLMLTDCTCQRLYLTLGLFTRHSMCTHMMSHGVWGALLSPVTKSINKPHDMTTILLWTCTVVCEILFQVIIPFFIIICCKWL